MGSDHSLVQYERRLNEVLNHIDSHFDRALSLKDLANVAYFSEFHFHRIFRAYVGETPSGYLRRLRIQKSVALLDQRPKILLSRIAQDCGFSQSSDFTRAFKEVHGYPPSQHRPGKIAEDSKIRQDILKNTGYSFGVESEQLPGDVFEVGVECLPEMRMGYLRVIGGFKPEKLMTALNRLLEWGRQSRLYPGARLICSSMDNPEVVPMAQYRTDLGIVLPPGSPEADGLSFRTIPAQRYALLHCRGDYPKLYRAWSYLYAHWLPSSGYEPIDAPNLELYPSSHEENDWSAVDLHCCLPIQPLQTS